MLKVFQYGGEFEVDPNLTDSLGTHTPKLPTIEITSSGPGQGKTQLLYFMITRAVLPAVDATSGATLNGLDSAVVILDTDGHFEISRLAQVMQLYISVHRASRLKDSGEQGHNSAKQLVADDIDSALIHRCLKHVHVFSPPSFESLLTTLDSLEAYLSDFEEHFSEQRALSAILLDSVNAFYWQERRKAEDEKLSIHLQMHDASSSHVGPTSPSINSYVQLRQSLTLLAKKYSCTIVVTTRSSSRNVRLRSHEAIVKPELPPPWPMFPILRLVVTRVPVDKFPPMHSIQEALRDKVARQEVVSQGRYEILLNHWSAETWNEGIKSALERRVTTIPLWIGDEGSWVKDDGLPSEHWPPWMDLLKPKGEMKPDE